jgi:hypothetical protein
MLPVESHAPHGTHRAPALREIALTEAKGTTSRARIRACKFDLAQRGPDSVMTGHHIVLHIVNALP